MNERMTPSSNRDQSFLQGWREGGSCNLFLLILLLLFFKLPWIFCPRSYVLELTWPRDWHVLIDVMPEFIVRHWVIHCEWLQSRPTLIARSWVHSTKTPECFTVGMGGGVGMDTVERQPKRPLQEFRGDLWEAVSFKIDFALPLACPKLASLQSQWNDASPHPALPFSFQLNPLV